GKRVAHDEETLEQQLLDPAVGHSGGAGRAEPVPKHVDLACGERRGDPHEGYRRPIEGRPSVRTHITIPQSAIRNRFISRAPHLRAARPPCRRAYSRWAARRVRPGGAARPAPPAPRPGRAPPPGRAHPPL